MPRLRARATLVWVEGFMDELNAAGVIPVSLIRWELTGMADQIIEMTEEPDAGAG